MARVVYRTLAVRDEAPPAKTVDHILVERGGPPSHGVVIVPGVALASILAVEFPVAHSALLLGALVASAVFVLLRRGREPLRLTVDHGAKTIAWGDVAIPFSEIAYPLFDWSAKELVLVKKHLDERVLVTGGFPDSCEDARTHIARALIAEYESFRDMPPTLAALARQLDSVRSAKEKNDALDKVLRTLPLEDVVVTEAAGVLSARGERDGLDVLVRYLRSKDRPEVIVQRRISASNHIELLRGAFSTNASGLVELTHRIFVNGAANGIALERREENRRILHDMERLDLRHVYLWPAEVKIIPYASFLELRDPDLRVADWIALAVACAEDVA